jgi:hypothetical protein
MTDRHDATVGGRRDRADGTETVEAYEVDGGVVLHDAQDPFAWVEASTAVDLRERT